MSERYNGNTGWQEDESGNVVPDYEGVNGPVFKGYDSKIPHDSTSQLDVQSLEQKLAEGQAISPEEARNLNEKAKRERGGTSLTPDPSRVKEMPREGRTNWQG